MRSASLFLLLAGLWGEAAGPSWGQDPRTLLDQAREHHGAGRWEQALAAYEAAAQAAETDDPATADLATAGTAYNNRCVLLTDQAEYRAALHDCERALELRRELDEKRGLARTLNNLGRVLQYLGRYDEARASFQEAIDLNRQRKDLPGIAVNQSNLGYLAIAAGDYERALWHLAQAEELSQQQSDEPWAAEQLRIVRLNRGVVFEKLGAYREALQLYRELMAESERMEPAHRATLEVNMGVLYRNLGDPVTAIERFDKAAAVFRELQDDAALSNALLNEALARHHNLRELDEAEGLYRQALELARRSGDRFEEMQDLFYLGELLRERGRLPEAELVFARGLEVAEISGSAEGRWSCLQGLGETALAAGRPREALEALLEAIEEIERVRASLRQESRRAGYFGGKRPVYASAISVLAELDREEPGKGHAEQALEVVQRAKARELLEAMGNRTGMAPLSADALRSRVGEARVLELFLARSRLYAWIIESDRVDMMDLGDARPLQTQVTDIHAALAAGREPPRDAIRNLSEILVERTGLLAGDPENLRIAPDGHLFYLPFELLEDRTSGRSLVERAAVSYLPCASLLPGPAANPPGPRTTELPFLGFGNPRLPVDSTAPTSAGLLLSRFQLRPLPAAERELSTVARSLPGESRIYVGEDATEATFRREARGARVIHLATHTLVDERLDGVAGAGTAVLMTPSEDDNGLLTPAEIAALGLRADLTVLASCRSALGSGDGQALASLTGSLLAAGSSSVIATLWDVEDDASAVFMEQLYHDLGRGLPPSAALRAAKRRLRAHPRWGSPHLWAGYVLVGEAPPVVDPWLTRWGLTLLLSLVAVVALALWVRRILR